MKRQAPFCQKIFERYICDKGLVSTKYKEFLNPNIKKTNEQLKMSKNISTERSTKTSRLQTSTRYQGNANENEIPLYTY